MQILACQIIVCCLLLTTAVLGQADSASAQVYVCPQGASEVSLSVSDTGCATWNGWQWVRVYAVPAGSSRPQAQPAQTLGDPKCSFYVAYRGTIQNNTRAIVHWAVTCNNIPGFGLGVHLSFNDHGGVRSTSPIATYCAPARPPGHSVTSYCPDSVINESAQSSGVQGATNNGRIFKEYYQMPSSGGCITVKRYLSATVHDYAQIYPFNIQNPQQVSATVCAPTACPSGYSIYNASWCRRSVRACPTSYSYRSWGCYWSGAPAHARYISHVWTVSWAPRR